MCVLPELIQGAAPILPSLFLGCFWLLQITAFLYYKFFSCCLSEYLLASFTAAWVGTLLATGRGGDRGLVDRCHAKCDADFGWVGTCMGVKGGGCSNWVLVEAFMRVFFNLVDLLW